MKNTAGDDYISRAIAKSIDPYNEWTPVSDQEVLDLLRKGHASAVLVETQGTSADAEPKWYEVRIVPPQYVEAKRQELENKKRMEALEHKFDKRC